MKKYQANLLLFLVSVIWGGGFIFVEILLNAGMAPGMITMIRGAIFSLCTFAIFFKRIVKMSRRDVKIGLIAGGTNALGFILQAIGQSMTTASHSSLITAIYVVFVPIVCWIFYKNRPGLKTFLAVIMCVLGAFLLVNSFAGEVNPKALLGDALVLLGAVMFALNIAYLGNSARQTHYGVVSFFMGVTMLVMSFVYVLISGDRGMPPRESTLVSVLSILYLGLLSSTLCQILQVYCQRHTSAVSASLILTLEGFFGGLFAIFYGDAITWNLIVGGLIIIISVFVQEIDFIALKKRLKMNKNK